MIPNHARFIEAINEKKKVRLRLYSVADNGVMDRVCAPMDYGSGAVNQDGLNRYWLWDYARNPGSHTLGLLPVDLQVLGRCSIPRNSTASMLHGLPRGIGVRGPDSLINRAAPKKLKRKPKK
jgi:hypothetical protein